MKRENCRHYLALIFLGLLCLADLHSIDKNRVLLISSYHPGFPTFFNQIEGIKSVFDTASIDLEVEFMDSKRFIDNKNKQLFSKYLSYKLSNTPGYDAIITSDDNAFNFAVDFQDSLFLHIPIIFCSVNDLDNALAQNQNPFITGVIESISMEETLQLMVALFPYADTIYSIVDKTPSGQGDLKTFYSFRNRFEGIQFSELSLVNTTFESFGKRLQGVSQNNPVLLLSAYYDKTNQPIGFKESLQFITDNLKSPLFHLWYHGMGEGIFGGKLISHFEQGKTAAEIAYSILRGKKDPSLAVLNKVLMYLYLIIRN